MPWGIENGLHQRLDISHNDDRCRVRNDNAMLVLGMMLRLSNSLFMQWSGYKRRPDHVTTTDFQSALSEDHHRPALRLSLEQTSQPQTTFMNWRRGKPTQNFLLYRATTCQSHKFTALY